MAKRDVFKFYAEVNGERKQICRITVLGASELNIVVPQPLALGYDTTNEIVHSHFSVHGGRPDSAGTLIKETKQTSAQLIEHAQFIHHSSDGWCVPILSYVFPNLRIGLYDLKVKSTDKLIHVTSFDARRNTLVMAVLVSRKPFVMPNNWQRGWNFHSVDLDEFSVGVIHLFSAMPSNSQSQTGIPCTSLPRIDRGPISQQEIPFYGYQDLSTIEAQIGLLLRQCLEAQHRRLQVHFLEHGIEWTPEVEAYATHVVFKPVETYD